MTLDPDIQAVIDALNSGFPKGRDDDRAEVRAAIVARRRPADNIEKVGDVTDRTVDGPAGDIAVRIYRPLAESPAPALVVFAHGGGFVFCDLDSHDALCRAMANGLGAVVVAVDHRLAPNIAGRRPPRICTRSPTGRRNASAPERTRAVSSSPATARAANLAAVTCVRPGTGPVPRSPPSCCSTR